MHVGFGVYGGGRSASSERRRVIAHSGAPEAERRSPAPRNFLYPEGGRQANRKFSDAQALMVKGVPKQRAALLRRDRVSLVLVVVLFGGCGNGGELCAAEQDAGDA